jgi:hypothetical protein
LDETKLEELRRWSQALRKAGDERGIAAGRAIVMLIEELERARLELSGTREQLDHLNQVSNASDPASAADTVASTLHERLQRGLGQDSDQSLPVQGEPSQEDTGPGVEGDAETASARSWIDTLRRQK